MLADVVDLLRCPVCGSGLALGDAVLRCGEGHSFDVARQGYVNLCRARATATEMVEAREAFLDAGHLRALTAAIVEEAAGVDASGAIVDLGAGTGHHLAHLLDALPDRVGLALDASHRRASPRRAKPPARGGHRRRRLEAASAPGRRGRASS